MFHKLFVFVALVSICSVTTSCTGDPVPRLISREHLRESSQRDVVQAFRDLTRKPPDKMAVQEDCDKIHSYYIEILSKAPGSPLAYLVFREIYSFYPATFSAMKKKNSRGIDWFDSLREMAEKDQGVRQVAARLVLARAYLCNPEHYPLFEDDKQKLKASGKNIEEIEKNRDEGRKIDWKETEAIVERIIADRRSKALWPLAKMYRIELMIDRWWSEFHEAQRAREEKPVTNEGLLDCPQISTLPPFILSPSQVAQIKNLLLEVSHMSREYEYLAQNAEIDILRSYGGLSREEDSKLNDQKFSLALAQNIDKLSVYVNPLPVRYAAEAVDRCILEPEQKQKEMFQKFINLLNDRNDPPEYGRSHRMHYYEKYIRRCGDSKEARKYAQLGLDLATKEDYRERYREILRKIDER